MDLSTWGFINSFGLFQTFYATALKQSPSAVSWIGSVQIFVPFLIGSFSGRALDAGFFRLTFVIGAIIQVLGLFMTSLCKEYWQVFLAQGICVGIGNGLVFVPAVALCSTYFLKHRGLALGVAASGSATGGLVYPAIAESLLPKVGFGWTVRVMGFLMTATMVLSVVFLRTHLPPRKSGPIVEWAAFTEPPYALFAAASFLFFWALYIGFYYVGLRLPAFPFAFDPSRLLTSNLGSFAKSTLHAPQSTSISLLLTMNGVGLPSRLISNYLADKYFGPLNLIILGAAGSAAIMYSWIAVYSAAGMWIFSIMYGIFAAAMQGLFPATLASLTNDPKVSPGIESQYQYGNREVELT